VSISVVKYSWVKYNEVLQCSDGLSNKMSNIIRRRIDNMKLLLMCISRLSRFFIFFRFCCFINEYMVVFMSNTVIYVFLLLYLCIRIVYLCIFIVPAGTLRLT
jgi:hypothetical protein